MANPHPTTYEASVFMNNKVEFVTPAYLDECIICLESYEQEAGARITGIPGCTHVIGSKCLMRLLTANPREEKKCPICRTVWIPASPQAQNRGDIRRHLRPLASNIIRDQRRAVASTPARTSAAPPADVINIDSDSDSDPLESFQRSARELEDIRSRARYTQLSRRQRRLVDGEAAAQGQERGHVRNNLPFNTARLFSRSTHQGMPSQRLPEDRSLSPFGPCSPPLASTSRRARYRLEGLFEARERRPTPLQTTPSPDLDSGNFDMCVVEPRRTANDDLDVNMVSPTSPFRISSSPSYNPPNSPTYNPPSPTFEERNYPGPVIAQRLRAIEPREGELCDEERRIQTRARELHRAEQAVFVREQRVAQRERKRDEAEELAKRQLNELKTMVARHEEERRRL
jgi:hypothetical protein